MNAWLLLAAAPDKVGAELVLSNIQTAQANRRALDDTKRSIRSAAWAG
jgi:hypothetical protein